MCHPESAWAVFLLYFDGTTNSCIEEKLILLKHEYGHPATLPNMNKD